jgi:hypothetical protein
MIADLDTVADLERGLRDQNQLAGDRSRANLRQHGLLPYGAYVPRRGVASPLR